MVGADAAAERGYTGAGVLVGVVDSGIQPDHPELAANFSGISYDPETGGPALDDPDGHGTHVSGIIAGARNGVGIRGLAYGARLALIRTPTTQDFDLFDAEIGPGYDYAIAKGVRIFNNSWGWDFYLGTELGQQAADEGMAGQIGAFRRAAEAGSVIVFSTGNEAQLQPNVQAGLPYYVPELRNNWLAVTAVGRGGAIASYANRCGLAAAWCLAAPGGEYPAEGEEAEDTYIISTYPGTSFEALAGTSMAAPHVTATVAIARQMFPSAAPADLQRIVLATATDLGAPGVDDVYGWGLLNVANLARTRDPQAVSLFANGAWAADRSLSALAATLDGRLRAGGAPGAWGSAIGDRSAHGASAAAVGAGADTLGFSLGYDLLAGPGRLFGAAVSWTDTDAGEDGLRNSARINTVSFSAYGALTRGALFAEGSASLGRIRYNFRRGSVTGAEGTVLAGLGLTGRASTHGFGAYIDARTGVAFHTRLGQVRPFLHGAVSHQRADAFAERRADADVFALAVAGFDATRYEAGPGLQLAFSPRPLGRAAVSGDVDARYDFVGGDRYAVRALLLGSSVPGEVGGFGDRLTLSAGLKAAFGPRVEASARGYWSDSDRADGHGVSLLLRAAF